MTMISNASNALGFDIYKMLSRGNSDNLAISPASISTALAMTWTGSRGITAEEMAKVLHLDVSPETAASEYAAVMSGIVSRASSNGIELALANRIFNDSHISIGDEFLEVLRNGYDASAQSVNFANSENARYVINYWVEQKTKERIKNLLTPGSVGSDTKVVLVNALYLLASWAKAFDESKTYATQFKSGGGKFCPCNMMWVKDEFRYAKTNNADVVEIPYQGGNMSMIIIVPSSDTGLEAVELGLSSNKLRSLRSQLRRQKITLRMPRFTIDPSNPISLGITLRDLGMPTAFSEDADFTGMTDGTTAISDVFHKTFVKVSESGTEMAAATAVSTLRSMSMDPVVVADHPFFWAIIDHADDFILGMGRVTQPKE